MLSTYVSYLKYAQSLAKTETRIAAQPFVSREAQYYRDNIGKVKTVDEFLNNYRLFSYAMKANGLEEMTYAKGFMRKVLLSDLTDSSSFANKLTDKRYVEFAKAFNFNASDGSLTDTTAIQSEDQLSDTTTRYNALFPNADRQSNDSYYWLHIDNVTSVDYIVLDEKMRDVALRAYGIDPDTVSEDALRQTLTSDLSDPNSYANTLGDARFVALAAAYNFDTDGSVKDGYEAQSDAQLLTTDELYLGQPETAYFKAMLGGIETVDDLLADDNMRNYVITAFGLEADTTTDALRATLTSDLSDPASFANAIDDERFVALAGAFNFDTDGSIKSGYDLQSSTQASNLIDLYYKETHPKLDTEVDYYQQSIGSIQSVDDLLASEELTAYVLTAYGIDPEYTSADAIRAALTSDLSDPNSYANQEGYEEFLALAQAFNFDTDGTVKAGYDAQSAEQQAATTTAYIDATATAESTAAASASTVTSSYESAIAAAKSINDLLSDADVVDYILKAYGLEDEDVSTSTLRLVLESDVSDPNSYVNQIGDEKLKAFAADFNFAADGSIASPRVVQSERSIETMTAAYAEVLGDGAGAKVKAEEETAYYKEAITNITTLDDLLADKRLTDYIITSLKLDEDTTIATLRSVLTSDLNDSQSVASKLGGRYRELAIAFNFTTSGTIAREPGQSAQSAKNVQATYDSYIAQTMETEAGDESEGARLALYFRRKAPSIDSAMDLLADKALAEVARTALGIPADAVNADLDLQARQITNRLDIEDLKDEDFLDKFLAKFAALYDLSSGLYSTNSSAVSLIGQTLSGNGAANTATIIGFGEDLLSSAMNVRKI